MPETQWVDISSTVPKKLTLIIFIKFIHHTTKKELMKMSQFDANYTKPKIVKVMINLHYYSLIYELLSTEFVAVHWE
ncbi:MAG: hypothetical protein ACJ71K_00735 [Nitrososphaeraceae archaeon]